MQCLSSVDSLNGMCPKCNAPLCDVKIPPHANSDNVIHLTEGLVPFWDDYLINTRYTDAELSSNKPEKRDVVAMFDKYWDGNPGYFHVIKDDDKYRMYYDCNGVGFLQIACMESTDGIHWEAPNLGIFEVNGSYDNSVVIEKILDNCCVMKDENPNCHPDEKYKAVLSCSELDGYENVPEGVTYGLVCMTSPDGYHFKKKNMVSHGLHYDSLNTLHWNPHTKKYYLFARVILPHPDFTAVRFEEGIGVRTIAIQESEDFINWTKPVLINMQGAEDYPLYTNCVMAYPYDTRYYIGFPTRYNERKGWSQNYDRLPDVEGRKKRSADVMRYGTVVTDCVFMSSRDYYNWYRFDEACITPGPEHVTNWVYGDGYPVQNCLIEIPSPFKGCPPEMSILVPNNHGHVDVPTELERYVYRRDGFASVKAGYKPKRLLTKQFTFEGDELTLNFRTSARGFIKIQVVDHRNVPLEGYTTCEIFGDALDRVVDFERSLSDLHGQVIGLDITMSDAEIYAMRLR
ncbi:MAG: hypothetical protein E7672_04335 [Ruminococcaceae bacterium]|nr:hypothetical protein [Oscillospiraceae bacterium]